jgi:hypothetical protein
MQKIVRLISLFRFIFRFGIQSSELERTMASTANALEKYQVLREIGRFEEPL